MRRFKSILLTIALSFSLLFMCVGYAAITDELTISGSVENTVQNNVFITDITGVDTTEGVLNINSFIDTTMNTSLMLADVNSEVTYKITLYNNNSQSRFYYNDYTYDSSFSDNTNISFRVSANKYDIIGKNAETSFDITFYYSGDKTVANPNLNLNSVIKFNYTDLGNKKKITIGLSGQEKVEFVDQSVTSYKITNANVEGKKVVRANGEGTPSYNATDGTLTVSLITSDCTITAWDTLTEAINYDGGNYYNDTTINCLYLLDNCNNEPTDESIVIDSHEYFSINFVGRYVNTSCPIVNDGRFAFYESASYVGAIYNSGLSAVINHRKDARLYISGVDIYATGTSDVKPKNITIYENEDNWGGVVTVNDGNVYINSSYIHASNGFGLYKKNVNAGKVGRDVTSKETIDIVRSTIRGLNNNAIVLADGMGELRVQGSNIQSYTNNSIVAIRHPLETGSNFDKYYQNAITDMRVYMTQGSVDCYTNNYHFASTTNARMYYTSLVGLQINQASATTFNTNFRKNDANYPTSYPVAVPNGHGNGVDNGTLSAEDWYIIKYKNINGVMTKLLKPDGTPFQVGDKFMPVNVNIPDFYINSALYDDSLNYAGGNAASLVFAKFEAGLQEKTLMHYFTMLKSSSENYVNMVLLMYPDTALHVEQSSTSINLSTTNVGVKLVSNRINNSNNTLDKENQRILIEENTQNAENVTNLTVLYKTFYGTCITYYNFGGDSVFNSNDPYNQASTVVTANTAKEGVYLISNAVFPNYWRNRWSFDFE